MTSIATNRAAIRVHYHGIKNEQAQNQAFTRLSSVKGLTKHLMTLVDFLLLAG